MGKGSNTTTTSQNQTYAPAGASYIQNALNTAQNAANLPFNIPQAPVAGFSQDQLSAFQNVNNAQGMAQPYINTAAGYFSPQGTQQFYNPMAQNVTAQLQNIFGQQNTQNTADLVHSAGGVGADRIAVGQGNLANQQGLAAGQTYANLWGQAAQQAQSAGYGTAALGSQAQNEALQGAQAQLGTGGLQQQLAQAQLNAPYQQKLAQAAFPYQQANFLAGITGSLAPGLGGTSYGTGTTTGPSPSIWSQILGGGLAGAGILGGTGAFGNQGWLTGSSPSYGGGNAFSGDAYGGSGSNPLAGLSPGDYGAGYAPGGGVNPYAQGGMSDEPINPDNWMQQSVVPTAQIPRIQTQMPQLNLNPPQQSQSGSGGFGDILKTGLQLATMFETGGSVPREKMRKFDGFNPHSFFEHRFPQGYDIGGSTPDFTERFPGYTSALQNGAESNALFGTGHTASQLAKGYPEGSPFNPMRMDPQADEVWRKGTDAVQGTPEEIAAGAKPDAMTSAAALPPASSPTSGQGMPGTATQAAPTSSSPAKEESFLNSPWAALTAAGLGIMGGTSPFAGVNIGQGGMQGLKLLEQQQAAAQKQQQIDLQAKAHEDQYTRATPYQQFEMKKPQVLGKNVWGQPVYGVLDPKSGTWVNPQTGKPVDSGELHEADDQFVESQAQAIAHYQQPPISPYKITTPVGAAMMTRARQIAQDEGRIYNAQYYPEAQATRNKFAAGTGEALAVRSYNTTFRHLGLLEQALDAMDNGSWKTNNALRNAFKTEFGLSAAPTNFEAIRNIAGDELTKAIIGSKGALADREEMKATMDKNNSPKLLKGVLHDIYKPAALDQLQSLEQQYVAGTHGDTNFGEKLSPEVREALDAKKKQDETARQHPQAQGPAAGFTGRTATNKKTGQTLRETSSGQWVP